MTDLERIDEYRLPRFSWNFENLPDADHWFLLATAYMDSSAALFSRMIQSDVDDSFHHAKVAAGLLEHAVELFLKAVIVALGNRVPHHHHSDRLLAQVRGLIADDELRFSGRIDEVVARQPDAPGNQFLRYPSDTRGEPWSGHTHIDLSIWYQQAELLSGDFRRIESTLKERRRRDARGDTAPDI